MNSKVSEALNGEIKVGDTIMVVPNEDYGLLIGTITSIALLGDEDHETENETDDIYCDFSYEDYTNERKQELEAIFSGLYREPKKFRDICLDLVIMDPELLIRVDDVPTEPFRNEAAARIFFDQLINE